MVFGFLFRISRCMGTFLRDHLNFQNLFVWTNTKMISTCTKNFKFLRNLCEHEIMSIWEEKGNTPKDS